MVHWESLKYKDQPYVKITPTERAKGQHQGDCEKVAVYYVASGDALLVTLNENVLKRSIDRQLAREAAAKDKTRPRRRPRQSRGSARTSACKSTARPSTSSSSPEPRRPSVRHADLAPGAICRS